MASLRGRSSGSLVPVRRSADEPRRELSASSPWALLPVPIPDVDQLGGGQSSIPSNEKDEKSALLRLPSPPVPEEDNKETGPLRGLKYAVEMYATQEAFIRSAKACILAAKVVSYWLRRAFDLTPAGGLDCIVLGSCAAATYCTGDAGVGSTDGHSVGAAAGFSSAGRVSCRDNVDGLRCSLIRTRESHACLDIMLRWLSRPSDGRLLEGPPGAPRPSQPTLSRLRVSPVAPRPRRSRPRLPFRVSPRLSPDHLARIACPLTGRPCLRRPILPAAPQ